LTGKPGLAVIKLLSTSFMINETANINMINEISNFIMIMIDETSNIIMIMINTLP
jgi:hypothetical protein